MHANKRVKIFSGQIFCKPNEKSFVKSIKILNRINIFHAITMLFMFTSYQSNPAIKRYQESQNAGSNLLSTDFAEKLCKNN